MTTSSDSRMTAETLAPTLNVAMLFSHLGVRSSPESSGRLRVSQVRGVCDGGRWGRWLVSFA